MLDKQNEQLKLRRYLLGEINFEAEIEEIEIKLMVDEKYFEQLLIEEEELIQDYVDGELTTAERINFEGHFLISDERREKVIIARTLRKYIDEQEESKKRIKIDVEKQQKGRVKSFLPQTFVYRLSIALGIFVIAGLCITFVWNFYFRLSAAEQARGSLSRAYKLERPLELRITDFSYAPFANTRSESGEKVDIRERNRAERILLDEAVEHPTAENIHALARLYLAKREFDEAIRELEKVQTLTPDDAQVLTDLGVAYLEKSKIVSQADGGESLELAAKALDNFEQAIKLNPVLLEARFNKAISLQILKMPNQAKESWLEYLQLDGNSPWSQEARRNLELLDSQKSATTSPKELEKAFLAAFREKNETEAWQLLSRNREIIAERYLPLRLTMLSVESSGKDKEEILQALIYAGELEKQKAGDPFASEIAAYYAKVSLMTINSLRKAQAAMRNGYQLCLKGDFINALEQFRAAQRLFEQAGNVWEARLSEHFIGYCLRNTNRLNEALDLWIKSEIFCQQRSYKWFQYTNLYWIAGSQANLEQYTKSKSTYEKGLSIAEAGEDIYATQRFLLALATQSHRFGQKPMTLNYIQKITEISAVTETSPRQKWRNYSDILNILSSLELYGLAKVVASENIHLADALGDPLFISDSRIDMGIVNYKFGDFDKAQQLLNEGYQKTQSINEESSRNFLMGRATLSLAHLQRKAGNYELSAPLYEKALGIFAKLEIAPYRYEIQKGKLLSYLELRNNAELEKQIPLTIEIAEKYRKEILEQQQRDSFFDAEQTIYDVAVDFEYKNNRLEKAFAYAENSNSRSLLDWLSKGAEISYKNQKQIEIFFKETVEPLGLEEIRQKMPEQVQILQYTVLEKKTLIWLISKNRFSVSESKIEMGVLREKIQRYLKLITGADLETQEKAQLLSRELYNLLIDPVADELDPDKEICLIPHKILFHLPFAALTSLNGKPFLVEHRIFYAPSANVFLLSTKKAENKESFSEESLLAVGNPFFDPKEFDNLANLPTAEIEAQEISNFYSKSKILLGKNATKIAFQNAARKSEIIHFAGHYLVNEGVPLSSSLVFAKTGADPKENLLTNAELINIKTPKAKLVLLSACQTGVEGYYNGEGLIGLSRTFLAAGVPLVIASQWKVDSSATAELMKNFHRFRRQEKFSTTEALRRAQLEMLNSPNERNHSPYLWAAFAVYGGYAKF